MAENVTLIDLVDETVLKLFYKFLKAKGINYIILFVEPSDKLIGPVEKIGELYRVRVEDLGKICLVIGEEKSTRVFIGVEQRFSQLLTYKY